MVQDVYTPNSPPPTSSMTLSSVAMDQDPPSTRTNPLQVDSSANNNHLGPLPRTLSGPSFLQTLDRLLLAGVQQERRPSHSVTRSSTLCNVLACSGSSCAAQNVPLSKTCARLSTGRPHNDLKVFGQSSLVVPGAYTQSSVSRKRLCSRSLRLSLIDCDHGDNPGSSGTHKKRKLCEAQPRLSSKGSLRRRTTNGPISGLSGAFKLCYAKGPGSLRRAESLRAELSPTIAEEEEVLNEVIEQDRSTLRVSKYSELSTAFFPQDLPIIVGSATSPYAANAPTEPTTPTSTDQPFGAAQSLAFTNLPVLAPPPFELVPRAPLSREDAAERRIIVLLEREKANRDVEGLGTPPPRVLRRTEDEEERFWMVAPDLPHCEADPDVEDACSASLAYSDRQRNTFNRALSSSTPIELNVDSRVFEEVIQWFLEVMPPEDEFATTYTPGDLFDLLSTSNETRFHAGHVFMRYFHLVSCADEDEEPEALETITWDLAVACLALSVKFHRDVLSPLDVICAHEFLALAPHAMDFADLENAQRDVLEALSYHVGGATPSAFMEELWEALPTLRKLLGFDAGWDGVQGKAWDVLCDALQQQDLLRFPVSVLTAAAIVEGVLDVLVKRYKSTGRDSRGKTCKRDSRSSRKAALKCSRGVRLDIQEVLQISDEELVACQKWLGTFVESK